MAGLGPHFCLLVAVDGGTYGGTPALGLIWLERKLFTLT